MKRLSILVIAINLILSGCSKDKVLISTQIDECSNIKKVTNIRNNLFENLSYKEIMKRSDKDIYLYSKGEDNIIHYLIKAFKKAETNAKFIPIDLRYYRNVNFDNLIISNLPDIAINAFLKISKFTQQTFIMVNISNDKITIIPGQKINYFTKKVVINRNDLYGTEIVFNISDTSFAISNMKFTAGNVYSIIANDVKDMDLDLRSASNIQNLLGQQWMMPLFSIENSAITKGIYDTGIINFVDNEDTREIKTDKFQGMSVACYNTAQGKKF